MNFLKIIPLLLSFTYTAIADTGGPYEGVPDKEAGENPVVFRNPEIKKPLKYFISHIPKLKWDKKIHEPVTYSWTPIDGYHASFRELGYVRGRLLFEVRYVSDKNLSQGSDHTTAIVILARGFDTGKDSNLLTPIYYTSGGEIYNHTTKYVPNAHRHGAISISCHYSGNGGHVSKIFIRGTEDFGYMRFTPKKKDQKSQ